MSYQVITNRAYKGYSPGQIDELALKAFLEGLSSIQNFRVQLKTQCFQTLQEAVSYACNVDQIMSEEKQYANSRAVLIDDHEFGYDDCAFDNSADKANHETMRRTFD